jgi:hypothetical protein
MVPARPIFSMVDDAVLARTVHFRCCGPLDRGLQEGDDQQPFADAAHKT